MTNPKSSKAGKQRKFRANAPLHIRHKFMSAHLSKELRKQLKRRSLPLRKGDEVKIMRGKFSGTTGKVSEVDLKRLKIFMENIKAKQVSGKERPLPLEPSNLLITNPVMEDKRRLKMKVKVEVKVKA